MEGRIGVRRWRLEPAVAAVFLAALAIRALYLAGSTGAPTFDVPIVDAATYRIRALRLLHGEGMSPAFFWQPVFYPLFLAAVHALLGPAVWTAKAVQALVGAATCALTCRLGTLAFDRRTGLAAGLVTAVYGPLVFFDGELLATGWAALWSTALLVLLLRARDRFDWRDGLLLGACAGLGVLTRPTLLPFAAAAAAWLLVRGAGTPGRRRIGTAFALLGFLAATLPAAGLARHVTGRFTFLPASGGVNLWLGNNPDFERTVTTRVGEDWQALLSTSDATTPTRMWDGDRWFRGRVLDWIRRDPAAFAAGLGKKAVRFVNSREIPRNTDLYLYREWSPLLRALVWKAGGWGFPFGVLLPLAAAGLILRRRTVPVPLVLFVVLVPAAIVAVFVASRYRVPVVPALAVLAAEGARASWAILRAGSPAARAALAAGGTAAVLATTLPGPFPEELQPYAAELWCGVGAARRGAGELDAAEADYRRALDASRDYAPAWDGLGLVAAGRGDSDEAIRRFDEALRLDPESAVTNNNLGAALLEAGRPEDAAARFREALRIRPAYERAAANLKSAQAAADVAALRAEAAARPDDPEPRSRLAWQLATSGDPRVRDPGEAVRLAEEACSLTARRSARELYVLATAYAAAGRSADATATGNEALRAAESAGDEDLAAKIRAQLGRLGVGAPTANGR